MMKDALRMLKFALKSKDFHFFDSSLSFLFPDSESWPIEVSFLRAKETWTRGQQQEALEAVRKILRFGKIDDSNLRAKIFDSCGEWMVSSAPPTQLIPAIEGAVKFFEQSIAQKTHYFHSRMRWAWCCEVLFNANKTNVSYAFNAINGFSECVKLRTESSLSELLQMISLFFCIELDDRSYGLAARRIATLNDGVLLLILPQMFAQLQKDGSRSSSFVEGLLSKLLPKHFHVLLYPLLFIMRLNSATAIQIFEAFAQENPQAVQQSMILSDGLLLCSCSSLETWTDLLTKIVRLIYQQQYAKAQQLLRSAIELEPPPVEIRNDLLRLPAIRESTLPSVTEALHKLNVRARTTLHSIRTVQMDQVAPELAQLRNSVLAVPGTYSISSPIVGIAQFDPTLEIFNSKQRPRFVTIDGVDGSRHWSLLKGRSDLRLDQRVMLFFDLVNQHISHDFRQDSRTMHNFTYMITPLSPSSGLIQFVNGADTMYSLIFDYRKQRGVPIFNEQQLIEATFIRHRDLPLLIQRLEALQLAVSQTPDTDLRDSLWLASPGATEWISRLLRFTGSSAVMSIIGYVLGLGDRHPSNLMAHRFTGSVIHIDFSDCFEVNMSRIRFPELVPFRLTRMIRRAFGAIGIAGEYRTTCEQTVTLVRSHHDSIAAVLDIFLQEPLNMADEGESVCSMEENWTSRTWRPSASQASRGSQQISRKPSRESCVRSPGRTATQTRKCPWKVRSRR
jgi:tetratricopeptide (TPR) repeat protein